MRVFAILDELPKPSGLYPLNIDPESGKFTKTSNSLERAFNAIWGGYECMSYCFLFNIYIYIINYLIYIFEFIVFLTNPTVRYVLFGISRGFLFRISTQDVDSNRQEVRVVSRIFFSSLLLFFVLLLLCSYLFIL